MDQKILSHIKGFVSQIHLPSFIISGALGDGWVIGWFGSYVRSLIELGKLVTRLVIT